jgi:hypothetical protein
VGPKDINDKFTPDSIIVNYVDFDTEKEKSESGELDIITSIMVNGVQVYPTADVTIPVLAQFAKKTLERREREHLGAGA